MEYTVDVLHGLYISTMSQYISLCTHGNPENIYTIGHYIDIYSTSVKKETILVVSHRT